tara:strand:+ start:8845 stop:10095 length:1251 start_codon:yes stop_codon:yes gene_type:complete
MKNRKISIILGLFLICFSLTNENGVAQAQSKMVKKVHSTAFELSDGDRVVFLGNSLFENDLQYGYLELALTTSWPLRDVTYRNLGWSGDTVFGEARTYITAPSGYDLLIKQLKESRPTVVFVAYGSNEAFEKEEGLPVFVQGLNKLLNEIDELGARAILLSPVPMMLPESSRYEINRNSMLELYTNAISKIAGERGIRFIDIFKPLLEFNKNTKLSYNGLHLNESGYYVLANIILERLGLLSNNKRSIQIDVSKPSIKGTVRANILELEENKESLNFRIDEEYLPLPLPQGDFIPVDNKLKLKIDGLKNGSYALSSVGYEIITASAEEWKKGVAVRQGTAFDQANKLREKIIKKNELFFYQYRPLNRTYIIGFRSHEQGRHAQGLEDLGDVITSLEEQIALGRIPDSQIYQLRPIR